MTKRGEHLSVSIQIATAGHAGQFDKGGKPYILHSLTVMHKVGDDELTQCAAVLHDVIEDCSGKVITVNGVTHTISFQMLRDLGLPDQVVEALYCLTKMPGQTYEEYKAKVTSNTIAMRVKLEDLRTNSDLRRLKSRNITEKDIARVAKYMAFYAEIQDKLEGITND